MNMRPDVDSDEIVLRFAYDRALWRRAMTGWWQSVVPPEPFVRRILFWTVVWFGVGLFAIALSLAGLPSTLVLWRLGGAGLMVGVFGYLQRTRMERFWDEIGKHWDRAGETQATFGSSGIRLADDVSQRHLAWPGLHAIRKIRGGTVLRSGISMIVIPDAVLPDGMKGDSFRSRIRAWKAS